MYKKTIVIAVICFSLAGSVSAELPAVSVIRNGSVASGSLKKLRVSQASQSTQCTCQEPNEVACCDNPNSPSCRYIPRDYYIALGESCSAKTPFYCCANSGQVK